MAPLIQAILTRMGTVARSIETMQKCAHPLPMAVPTRLMWIAPAGSCWLFSQIL